MAIQDYTQGENHKSDRELFGLIGRFLVDATIHEKLGTAITSNNGDIWRLSVNSKSEVRGFCNARAMKNNSLHVRYLYCVSGADIVCKTLIKQAIELAQSSGCTSIWSNDRNSAVVWQEFGFEFTPRARGSFGRWEKQLELRK